VEVAPSPNSHAYEAGPEQFEGTADARKRTVLPTVVVAGTVAEQVRVHVCALTVTAVVAEAVPPGPVAVRV
jgi:hypothetical protein